MSVQLNHTIVHGKDKEESANFLVDILGLAPPKKFFHFLVVQVDNGVSLDFLSTHEEIQPQHYAFLVDETSFDKSLAKLQAKKISYYADPGLQQAGINHHDGGRGLYFKDPGGNVMEIITRPYGGSK